ncbi:hypothetical protein E8E13_001321 [Curvularia kusanoi]|uniref:Uncharacterized protein n=1 Tax=Curvularia kusanoi TaxID=90978 RepID=A0A9P4T5D7_CURKU|nr:hypothetical protein E8E13_001321 [Curvularia kusanoi]
MAYLQRSAFFEAIQRHDPNSTVVREQSSGKEHTYRSLLRDVYLAKENLLQITRKTEEDLAGERVAFLVENGYNFVVLFLAILATNAIAVPLPASAPVLGLKQIVQDSEALALLWSAHYAERMGTQLLEDLDMTVIHKQVNFPAEDATGDLEIKLIDFPKASSGGIMLFTSGTTARPKGVLLPVDTLIAQAQSLLMAWEYVPADHLLHVLPLHHIHGTVNALLAPILAGPTVEFMFPFNVDQVWGRLAAPFLGAAGVSNSTEGKNALDGKAQSAVPPITIFTAVPTIWARMLQAYSKMSLETQEVSRRAVSLNYLRLNISGSAALPKSIQDGWTNLSGGNLLLERYGMTEIGMALSCGLDHTDRIDGSVGWPLPSVEVRLWETDDFDGTGRLIENGEEIDATSGKERQGEIQLRGPTVFKGYWNNPTATKQEFTQNGWFKTGDIAIRRVVPGSGEGKSGPWACGPAYFIQGRQSADIIKTGGEKVSALEIERELLALPQVHECAVVGLPSEAWGQKVTAIVVLSEEWTDRVKAWTLKDMRSALRDRLIAYKIPQDLEIVDSIKRNAMGKINKRELIPEIFGNLEKLRRRSMGCK